MHIDSLRAEMLPYELRHIAVLSWKKLLAALDDVDLHSQPRQSLPSSQPMGPPPSTIMLSGFSFSSSKMVSFVKYRTSSMPSIFGMVARLPVAITKFLAR